MSESGIHPIPASPVTPQSIRTWLRAIEAEGSGVTDCSEDHDRLVASSLLFALTTRVMVRGDAIRWLRQHYNLSTFPRERRIAGALLDHFKAREV